MSLLMDYTNQGRSLINARQSGLEFQVTHVVYGLSGFNAGAPTTALPLVPLATSLVAEVFRKSIATQQVTDDEIVFQAEKKTVYTTLSGHEVSSVLGEAGLIATVTSAGGDFSVGDQVLLAQAHFPRIVFSVYQRLAIKWPLDFTPLAVFDETFDVDASWDDVVSPIPEPTFVVAGFDETFDVDASWDDVVTPVPTPTFAAADLGETFETGWDGV